MDRHKTEKCLHCKGTLEICTTLDHEYRDSSYKICYGTCTCVGPTTPYGPILTDLKPHQLRTDHENYDYTTNPRYASIQGDTSSPFPAEKGKGVDIRQQSLPYGASGGSRITPVASSSSSRVVELSTSTGIAADLGALSIGGSRAEGSESPDPLAQYLPAATAAKVNPRMRVLQQQQQHDGPESPDVLSVGKKSREAGTGAANMIKVVAIQHEGSIIFEDGYGGTLWTKGSDWQNTGQYFTCTVEGKSYYCLEWPQPEGHDHGMGKDKKSEGREKKDKGKQKKHRR